VRRLTIKQVREEHGGILPNDAVFRPDDDEELAARAAAPSKPKRRTKSQRFAILNTFTDFGIAAGRLTGSEVKVWLILFRDTKAYGTARAGQADIARRAGTDARAVRSVLVRLEAKGFVHVVRRGRLNGGPSIYRVHPTGTA